MKKLATHKKIIAIHRDGHTRVFESLLEAARELETHISSISNCLTGRQRSAKGYVWKYYEDYKEVNNES